MATRVIKRSKNGVNALAPQPRERIDLNEDFSDVDGDPNAEFALVDGEGNTLGPEGDSTYCYLWAKNDGDGTTGIPAFLAAIPPYEVVKYDKGVTPAPRGTEGFLTPGENIVVRDQVLMRCSRALKEKRRRYEATSHARRFTPLAKNLLTDHDKFVTRDDDNDRRSGSVLVRPGAAAAGRADFSSLGRE